MDDITVLRIRTPPPDKDMKEMEYIEVKRKSVMTKISRLAILLCSVAAWACFYTNTR